MTLQGPLETMKWIALALVSMIMLVKRQSGPKKTSVPYQSSLQDSFFYLITSEHKMFKIISRFLSTCIISKNFLQWDVLCCCCFFSFLYNTWKLIEWWYHLAYLDRNYYCFFQTFSHPFFHSLTGPATYGQVWHIYITQF